MGKRRKHRGHFCWCCGWILPNERFSGRGHARHLCRRCAKLGPAELAIRQELRNIDRLMRDYTIIPRKLRPQFERCLAHPNERVRRYAEQIAARSDEERDYLRRMHEEEEAELEAELEAYEWALVACGEAFPWGADGWHEGPGVEAFADFPPAVAWSEELPSPCEDAAWEDVPDPPDAAEAWPVDPESPP